jgi:hypothetical protein
MSTSVVEAKVGEGDLRDDSISDDWIGDGCIGYGTISDWQSKRRSATGETWRGAGVISLRTNACTGQRLTLSVRA